VRVALKASEKLDGWFASQWAGIAENDQQARHVVVVFGRGSGAAGNPGEYVWVGTVEQGLVALKLRLVKPGQVLIGKAPKDQVGLARAAVPGTEQQSFSANLGW
jgi:hypothetical protein